MQNTQKPNGFAFPPLNMPCGIFSTPLPEGGNEGCHAVG